ncbi:hypothetical protein Moror_8807 [Moniliophthora roreri MCA 2997]|uniref:Uncharacterized protein n=1 Tax=Moniliophthora roreri (strain MCA 2997) TaxID=1381753 RepID=V2W930_MONRO|nr:hypothetical protein Moror_8807 [Moniliophthora roreri MCA 2997]
MFVYITVLDATAEFEPQDLLDKKTKQPLLLARPLPDQYCQFHIDSDLDKMYTGHLPWFGVHRVEELGSYQVKVQIELDLFTAQGNTLEWVFIKDVLVVKTGQPIYAFWLILKSSIFYSSQEDLIPLQCRLQQTALPEAQSNVVMETLETADPWDLWDPHQKEPPHNPVSMSTGSMSPSRNHHAIWNHIFSQAPNILVLGDKDTEAPLTPQAIEGDRRNTYQLDNTHLWNRATLPTTARVFTGDEYMSPPPTPPCLLPSPPSLLSPPLPVASSSAASML